MNRRTGAVLAIALLAVFAVLAVRGHLWPLVPTPVIKWWVAQVVPRGTTYLDAQRKVVNHGWRESSSSGGCNQTGPFKGGSFIAEIGHLRVGVPVVPYVYAEFRFDSSCGLKDIEITKESDAP
ncbi:MAG TPA: hypothetical protein VNA69_24050 [Thermoanaerobaculia bacterium]|nr:hypothetical protein [Thermoanaerobaculia bacterium]